MSSSSANQTCYWPDGSIAPTYSSCNIGDSFSPCCRTNEACLQSGLCYGALGVIYRGACTSAAYPEGYCPNFCTAQNFKSWANLHSCHKGFKAEDFPVRFWCGNGTICEDTAPLGEFIGVRPENVLVIAGQSFLSDKTKDSPPSSTSSEILKATQNSTRNDSGNSSSTTQRITLPVGLGLGIPLMVLLVALIILWRRHAVQNRRREEKRLEEQKALEEKIQQLEEMRQEELKQARFFSPELESNYPLEVHGTSKLEELAGDQAFTELPVDSSQNKT